MIEHILKASLERHLTITIIYQNKGGITQRNVQVHSIRDGTVKAFCFLRNQNRIFKLENILAADYIRNSHLKMAK